MEKPLSDAALQPWLASYPDGVPAEIRLDADMTLVHLLEDAFRRHAGGDARSAWAHA
jgi:long-chain acyl-CoA synthetase